MGCLQINDSHLITGYVPCEVCGINGAICCPYCRVHFPTKSQLGRHQGIGIGCTPLAPQSPYLPFKPLPSWNKSYRNCLKSKFSSNSANFVTAQQRSYDTRHSGVEGCTGYSWTLPPKDQRFV
jgi:hypothetical protein